MRALCLISILLCATNVPAQSSKNVPREATPPALTLDTGKKPAKGVQQLEVKRVEVTAPSKGLLVPPAGGKSPAPVAKDLHLVTTSGAVMRLWGSRRIGLDTLVSRLEPKPAPKKGGTGSTMRLRFEQALEAGLKRFELLLQPLDRDSIIYGHFHKAGDAAMSHDVVPGFRFGQQVVAGALPDVEGASARRFFLPVKITTADGAWNVQGNSETLVTHRGARYLVQVHRSVRREPGTDANLPFEGARFNLSATITPEEAGTTTR